SRRPSHQSRAPCLFKLEERRDLRKTYERSSLASTCQLTLQKPMRGLLLEAPWLHSSRYSRCFQRAGTNHCALTRQSWRRVQVFRRLQRQRVVYGQIKSSSFLNGQIRKIIGHDIVFHLLSENFIYFFQT